MELGDKLKIYGLGAFLIILGFVLAYQFVEPAPPKTLTIATGSKSGAYFQFAQRYKNVLAREGLDLKIVNTKGSVDNIARLKSGEVEIAFVQSGTGDPEEAEKLYSLGSLYHEPLWVFSRGSQSDSLVELKGRKIATGVEGSGTWVIAEQVLAQNGVTDKNAKFMRLSSTDAAKGLLAGNLDAAFFVASLESPLIRELLAEPSLSLLNFARSRAYTQRHRFLSSVELPQGVVSLSKNIPATDTTLLAPVATLVGSEKLHPALVTLLVQAMTEIHGGGTVIDDPGQFPSTLYGDFPMNEQAERYIKNGQPFLQRYLPFWLAVLIDRLVVMIIPLIALMLPLSKVLPPTYRWRVRSKIYRYYRDLKEIEKAAVDEQDPSVLAQLSERLDGMKMELLRLTVPLSYSEELYQLRMHLNMVRDTVTTLQEAKSASG